MRTSAVRDAVGSAHWIQRNAASRVADAPTRASSGRAAAREVRREALGVAAVALADRRGERGERGDGRPPEPQVERGGRDLRPAALVEGRRRDGRGDVERLERRDRAADAALEVGPRGPRHARGDRGDVVRARREEVAVQVEEAVGERDDGQRVEQRARHHHLPAAPGHAEGRPRAREERVDPRGAARRRRGAAAAAAVDAQAGELQGEERARRQERERLPGEHRAPVSGAPEAGEDEEPAQGVQTAVVEVVGRLGRRVGPRRARLVGGARLGALEEDARLGIVQERPVEDVRLGSHLTRDQEGEPSCSSSTFC